MGIKESRATREEMRSTLRRIMRMAWKMYRQSGRTFSDCLKLSWSLVRKLSEGGKEAVSFCYRKVDGSIRFAVGIIADRKPGDDSSPVLYWDIVKNGWRSFRPENLMLKFA